VMSTKNIKKKPPPPPPLPPAPTKFQITKPVIHTAEGDLSEMMSGLNLLNLLTVARSNLKIIKGGDHVAQRPKQEANDDIRAALQRRFESIHGEDDDNSSDWDDWKDDNTSDNTWADDQEEML